jgi:hypothetical protein
MVSMNLLQSEIHTYLILADQLKAQYAGIDDETLRDTLEGISDVPELIAAVVRSMLEDDALIGALKSRMAEMQERLERFRARSDKKRELARWAMLKTGLDRIQAPDLSLSMRQGPARLDITDESRIPGEFFIHQAARLDRGGLISALKRGDLIAGAQLTPGDTNITVRVK